MNAKIEPALSRLIGAAAPPRRNGELVFDEPWQGRAFAVAVALVERLGLDWSELQRRLIDAIAASPERAYYESWLVALESLVVDHGLLTRAELEAAPPRSDR